MFLPSIAMAKTAFDIVMKAIGLVKDVAKEFEPTSKVTVSDELYEPGPTTVVERILHGKFPHIPAIYRVKFDEREREIEVKPVKYGSHIIWQFRGRGESVWWALTAENIQRIYWIEIVEIIYNPVSG